ncbi:hypothetical protein QQY24_33750 [Streptomyces sp. TG1A-8]|nr:hypothetical protein [Streptomyces sp. TG1A-8]MDO0930039.1 hypothetical protein [Streptomyces sp. TG1A-8]
MFMLVPHCGRTEAAGCYLRAAVSDSAMRAVMRLPTGSCSMSCSSATAL